MCVCVGGVSVIGGVGVVDVAGVVGGVCVCVCGEGGVSVVGVNGTYVNTQHIY